MFKTKKLFCIFLVSLLILNYATFCCNAIAIKDNEISPCYNHVDATTIILNNINGKIKVSIMVEGSSGTTYEGGILTLKRTVGSNTVFLENLRNLSSSTAIYSYYNDSHNATSGTYTVKFAIYAVKNGVRERINLEKTLVVS